MSREAQQALLKAISTLLRPLQPPFIAHSVPLSDEEGVALPRVPGLGESGGAPTEHHTDEEMSPRSTSTVSGRDERRRSPSSAKEDQEEGGMEKEPSTESQSPGIIDEAQKPLPVPTGKEASAPTPLAKAAGAGLPPFRDHLLLG